MFHTYIMACLEELLYEICVYVAQGIIRGKPVTCDQEHRVRLADISIYIWSTWFSKTAWRHRLSIKHFSDASGTGLVLLGRLNLQFQEAALRTLLSVCPFIRLSVRLWHLFHNVPLIIKFSGVITIDKSGVHAKGMRSKVKVTEIKANFAPIWMFPDCSSSLNSQMGKKLCTKLPVA